MKKRLTLYTVNETKLSKCSFFAKLPLKMSLFKIVKIEKACSVILPVRLDFNY